MCYIIAIVCVCCVQGYVSSHLLYYRSILEHWSAMGYDAYFILDLAIFHASWGRWPLGFDPEGMMLSYIKLKHENDDLLLLDYRNRYTLCVCACVRVCVCVCRYMLLG